MKTITLEKVTGTDDQIQTLYDILIKKIHNEGLLGLDRFIVCNGFKTDLYIDKIIELIDIKTNYHK